MAIAIIFVAALAWCGVLAWDAVRECRKIDRQAGSNRVGLGSDRSMPTLRNSNRPYLLGLAGTLEAR